MQVRKEEKSVIVILDRGEKIAETLNKFFKEQKIQGGAVWAIGAVKNPQIAYYDLDRKEYIVHRLEGDFELVNLCGNATQNGLHAHIVVGDKQGRCFGGHLMEAEVSITCEAFILPLSAIARKQDEETGLNLMHLD